jgi:hypothetical protein
MDDPTTGDAAGDTGRPARTVLTRRNALFLGAAGLAALPVFTLRSPAAERPTAGGTTVSPAAGEDAALDVRDFGAVGDGTADDTPALQRLITASADQGLPGLVPAGTYRCTASLHLPAGTHLQLAEGAHLLKDWAAEPGLAAAFLRNEDFGVKSDRVRITGPGTIGARDHSRTGVILALYGDDVHLSGFTIDTYAGGQAVMFAGDRGRMDRVTVRNSAVATGTGGIRVVGGTDFHATGCHVESGDDCLQFVPIGDPEALLYDMSISGGRFERCTGTSTATRFMVVLLEFTRGEPGTTDMSGSVTDCSFVDCHGAGTRRGIVVKNSHSSGTISRVSFTDCSVDMSGAPDEASQEIRIQTDAPPGGSIRDLTFTRTDITHPVNSTVRITGPNMRGITFDSCRFTAPSGTSNLAFVADSVDRLRVRRCTFTGAPGKRQLVAGPVGPLTAFSVEDSRFTDIPDGFWGVDLLGAPGARISDSTFRAARGATNAKGLRISASSTRVTVEGNDFSGISNPAPITDRATGTSLRRNRGA